MSLSLNRLFLLAALLVVVTNAFIFIGVALNRFGGETRTITLSERELSLPTWRRLGENSGISLQLNWSVAGNGNDAMYYSRQASWLDNQKLKALGFELPAAGADKKRIQTASRISKEVFIVLEYDGVAYKQVLQQAQTHLDQVLARYAAAPTPEQKSNLEYEQNMFENLKTSRSRLYAIDAGTDAQRLAGKYGDTSRYIIAKGIVRPVYNFNSKTFSGGYIENLSIEDIHVGAKNRHFFEALSQDKQREEPVHYEATLTYGSRFEPWLVSVKHEEADK